VDEALVLADRVLVLRDGRIDEELVTRGLYKGRSDPGFERARAKLLTLLEVRENTSRE
jgi:sulfonate transport system ATP-binding protein